MMKKITALLLALALLTMSCAAMAEEGDLLAKIKERGKLIIGTEGNWAPWTYHDENDVLTGLDVEIGKLIAARRGSGLPGNRLGFHSGRRGFRTL